MPHFPKPFFRPERNLWYVQVRGRQVNLGPEKDAAFTRYHELMAAPEPVFQPEAVVALIDAYLEWCQKNRARDTYEWYKAHCQSFIDTIPASLTVGQIKGFHVQQWVDGKNWSDGTKRGGMTALMRCFNWLTKQGFIARSPIAGLEKPQGGRREKVISPEQYKDILARFNDSFADTLAWETGARAQELWILEARHVDLAGRRWLFPAKEAKGRRRPRIVYLTDTALTITQRLMLKHPKGKLLRNKRGHPWTKYSVACRFHRLKKQIGEKLCLTNFRHSFATRQIESGTDSVLVAALLGHKDLSMLGRVYAHPSQSALTASLQRGA